ncbi:MAG: TonB-dependent receptor [Flavobacteriaceae bacterium]|nr:TonB-dependent receptor [Flavobacteriaceae bacterium]
MKNINLYFQHTLLYVVLLSATLVYAQKSIAIKGKIVASESMETLPYATVSFVDAANGDKVVNGGLTDEVGNFSIKVKSGKYKIIIDYIGFESSVIASKIYSESANIGNIQMESKSTELEGVDVVSQMAEMEIRLDKRIYNVSQSLVTKGGTVSDVLENVPSVSVDIDGNIELRGNTNVRILIDGKPSGLASVGGVEALSKLPAETIQKVEVITSPSARYQAEGSTGIINIVTTKQFLKGLNGVFSTSAGRNDSYGGTANINYKKGKFNFFTNSGYRDNTNLGGAYQKNTYVSNSLIDQFIEERSFDRRREGFNINFGTDINLGKKTSFSLIYTNTHRDGIDVTVNSQTQFLSDNTQIKSTRNEDEVDLDMNDQVSFNFEHKFNDAGHLLTVNLQKEWNEELETASLQSFDDTGNASEPFEKNITDDQQNRELAQIDYVYPIDENTQFEAGYRGNINNQVIDFEVLIEDASKNLIRNTDLSNTLNYSEEVHAFYSQFGKKYGDFSILAGLRLEDTRVGVYQLSGDYENGEKNYRDLFPTLNLGLVINPTTSVTLGYNRRITRPNSWFLNPFQSRSSRTSFFQGNPEVNPSYSNGVDIGYIKQFKKFTLNSSLYYRHSTESISRVAVTSGETVLVNGIETDVIKRFPVNLGTTNEYGVEFNSSIRAIRGMRTNLSVNFFKREENGTYEGVRYDTESVSWTGSLSNSYTFPYKIRSQISMRYRGPNKSSFGTSKGFLYSNLALSKDVLNEKATLNLRFNDLFNTIKYRYTTETDFVTIDGDYQRRKPTFTLTFTYRFRQEEARQSRRRTGGYDSGSDGGGFEF